MRVLIFEVPVVVAANGDICWKLLHAVWPHSIRGIASNKHLPARVAEAEAQPIVHDDAVVFGIGASFEAQKCGPCASE